MTASQHGDGAECDQRGGVGRDLQIEVGTGVDQQGSDAHGCAETYAIAIDRLALPQGT